MNDPTEKLLRIVLNAKGDDLERAEAAFKRLSPEQMLEYHGDSGRTVQEILEGYREEREEWQDAYDLLKELIKHNELWNIK